MTKLQLSLGCIKYDRTRALFDGDLLPEGIDLITKEIVDHDSFWLIPIRYKIFDVAEMPLTNYIIGLDEGHTDLIALPIFPSRSFRHSTLYINKHADIRTPKDLEGKRIGIGNYFGSTTLWTRGLLREQHQVSLEDIRWVTKNKVSGEKIPKGIQLTVLDAEQNMERLLEAGEIDALITERPPAAYGKAGSVMRLFENYKDTEMEYYQSTGIFPIRHVLVVKREIVEKHPWVSQSLCTMFSLAKRRAYLDRMFDGHSQYMLPFMQNAIAETKRVFGSEDVWKYGLTNNEATLSAFTKYCFDQGYTKKLYSFEQLFTKDSMDLLT